nr:ORF1 [Epsilontorquevirus sp.]
MAAGHIREGRRRYGRRRRYRGRRRRKVRHYKLFPRVRRRVLRQWEPNSTVRCKITGHEYALFWGREAAFRIMTDNLPWPTKTGEWEGGAMNLLQHTLWFLYNDQLLGKNRWSRSNSGYDLCKYHGTKFWFHRHESISYVVVLDRQGHFMLDTETYQNLHPEVMFHAKKRILVLSKRLKPHGKQSVKIWMPPPQLMKTQWYFQADFCKIPLFTMLISAIDITDNILKGGQFNTSVLLWGFPYWSRPMPYDTYLDYICKCWGPQTDPWIERKQYQYQETKLLTKEMNKKAEAAFKDWALGCQKLLGSQFGLHNTAVLIDYKKAVTSAMEKHSQQIAITLNRWHPTWPNDWSTTENVKQQRPFSFRYNWNRDLGTGNKIMLYTRECREGIPEADNKLEDKPLYVLANGYLDYILKHSTHNPLNWVVIVWCPYTFPPMEGIVPVNMQWFQQVLTPGQNKVKEATDATHKGLIRGWGDNETTGYTKHNCKWDQAKQTSKTSTAYNEPQKLMQGTIARAPDVLDSELFFKAMYECSPFTWKLNSTPGNIFFTYQSRWTWGGDFQKQKPIEDPCKKPKWGTIPISSYDERGVQIQNPKENKPHYLLHDWDIRRGDVTGRALKRLMRLDSTETEEGQSPKKKERRHKEPLTAEERIAPEDVFLYLPSPEPPKGKQGKSAEDCFVDEYKNCAQLAKKIYQLDKENRQYRHHLRSFLRKQRHRVDNFRLLLG